RLRQRVRRDCELRDDRRGAGEGRQGGRVQGAGGGPAGGERGREGAPHPGAGRGRPADPEDRPRPDRGRQAGRRAEQVTHAPERNPRMTPPRTFRPVAALALAAGLVLAPGGCGKTKPTADNPPAPPTPGPAPGPGPGPNPNPGPGPKPPAKVDPA